VTPPQRARHKLTLRRPGSAIASCCRFQISDAPALGADASS
jgi:hypothetical protein